MLTDFSEIPVEPAKLIECFDKTMQLPEADKIEMVEYNIAEWTRYFASNGCLISKICNYMLPLVKACPVGDKIAESTVNRIVAHEWHAFQSEHGTLEAERRGMIFSPKSFSEAFKQTESSWREQGQLFRFGIDELDGAIGGGVSEGQLLSIIGNPGSMKTSLLLNGIQQWVADGGSGAAFFSLDMGRVPVMERLLARELNCAPSRVKQLAEAGSPLYEEAKRRLARFYDGKVDVLENTLSVRWTVEGIKEYVERNIPKLVCIDYLTLLKGADQSDFEIANQATAELLTSAKAYGCVLVILSQMSVESQRLQSQGGTGGSARGGGYVNERADAEIELFRDTGDDEYGRDNGAEIIATVKKTRKGGTGGSYRLDYAGEPMRFKSTASRVSRVKKRKKIFGHADASWHEYKNQ